MRSGQMEQLKRFGVLTPCRIESGRRDGEELLAGEACEMCVVMLAWKCSMKSIVWIALHKAYYTALHAVWAQPMRIIAVGRRLAEYIQHSAGSKTLQYIAVTVRLKLLEIEELLFERITLVEDALILLDQANVCRLMLDQLLVDFNEGRADFRAVRHAHERLQDFKGCLKRLCGARRELDKGYWIHARNLHVV